jgi:MoaA/NifB/PqqE/SkfB family radical SAM enzyme
VARDLAKRVLGRSRRDFSLPHPPPQPIGAKLELTFACNLRCGFCYTDSPRHTLARTPELDDDQWRRVTTEAIDAGALEAVITGGEPLLRRDLALEVLEQLDAAGVTTYLNTNGWFVDEAVADRLAKLRALHVYISIDGATAARHDGARGVPGSWRRAIEGTSRLLDRGVITHVVQVVTPDNRDEVEQALELFWRLGVATVQLTPVGPVGAAARGGDWHVDPLGLAQVVERAEPRYAPHMRLLLRGGGTDRFDPLAGAPASFLVRPDGIVRISSSVPFSFGDVRDGLPAAWEAIRTGWNAPEVERWLAATRRRSELHKADLVPYLDPDLPLSAEPSATQAPGGRDARAPAASRARRPEHQTVAAASEFVDGLALARPYRLGDVRSSDAGAGNRFVSVLGSGVMTRLNASAATVMQACADGTPADAIAALGERHPDVPREQLAADVTAAVRLLVARGVIVPALAPARAAGRHTTELPTPTAALTT